MSVNRRRHPCEPASFSREFEHFCRREELDAVGRGVAERLEQARGDEDRHVVKLAAQHPSGLLCRQPRGELTRYREEPVLIVPHINNAVAAQPSNRTDFPIA